MVNVWVSLSVCVIVSCVCVSAIPVSVMLSLTQVSMDGSLVNPSKLNSDFKQLKSGGVDGVMGDVWWGIVEQQPGVYNWTAYVQIASIAAQNGLTYQPIMSFHECGGNVGDDCYYPIPSWASSVAKSNDLLYKDKHNAVDLEYLSLSADSVALFPSASPSIYRTASQVYADYMSSFKKALAAYIPKTVNVIQVGMGPAGEMRYPGYQLDRWTYCGVGEFQCYDSRMLANLSAAATAAGHSDWGNAGPSDAGTYNSCPFNTNFWIDNGNTDNFASPYGQFFIGWYSGLLLDHGRTVLSQAQQIYKGSGVELSAKVAGVHWWYSDHSHSAEVTSGYYNTNSQNAYLNIAKMFADYNTNFDFTALELKDGTQYGQCESYTNNPCGSLPEELVGQTIQASQSAHINYEGENALTICPETTGTCNQAAFNQILYQSTRYGPIHRFTFLRISDNLLYNSVNWNMFTSFVAQMKAAG